MFDKPTKLFFVHLRHFWGVQAVVSPPTSFSLKVALEVSASAHCIRKYSIPENEYIDIKTSYDPSPFHLITHCIAS